MGQGTAANYSACFFAADRTHVARRRLLIARRRFFGCWITISGEFFWDCIRLYCVWSNCSTFSFSFFNRASLGLDLLLRWYVFCFLFFFYARFLRPSSFRSLDHVMMWCLHRLLRLCARSRGICTSQPLRQGFCRSKQFIAQCNKSL